ncbi:hypothetical protein COCC4DRAFT_19443 [Bipolaris maydis ATCC 48331]|uniref:Uncharacterized protein n=2 Tax=Cochliobolus heterostrophus TaxID=5016 RepID=M2UPM4_COCH5|nr:uncharacterized protein COCC4DRAFT_19443 [Bipolaris maydis ATCC 48331]EMD89842.1 hypothetical protein COCHEDRAFT_1195152 [Bipolaris maydis C5]KAH7563301.1 hypothetical protein BM1_00348 [Bipolaris maydis]ENI09945.1 hypothetical protein COCC4DRAFT_19443 [Bipolaris maydis ATCC 48331]KAJ5025461.1 hypothetical protein J3E73DRAFT_432362 [Bipolaris maydis]KAJ5064062.1 hypothetical protein J3E74DRAFT_235825 [Bipolaris maydis]
MPIERTDRNNPRPLKPTLASTRPAPAKTPLTPRLAVASSASSTVSSSSTRTARTSTGAPTRPHVAAAAVDSGTSAKPLLTTSLTPRTSSRKSRTGVDSAATTPNATPTNSRPSSTVDFPHRDHHSAVSSSHSAVGRSSGGAARPRSTPGPASHAAPTPRAHVSSMYNYAPSDAGSRRDTSSLFFHANDARPHDQPAPAPAPVKKTPTFFYADGRQDEGPAHNVPSPPSSSLGRAPSEAKFFHADSIAESRDRPPILTPPPIATSPEPPPPLAAPHGPSLRPPSPTKDWAHLSYRKGASQVRPALSRGTSASTGSTPLAILGGSNTADASDVNRRRSSTASMIKRGGHAKSSSLSSIDSVTSLRKASAHEAPAMTPSPLHTEKSAAGNASPPENPASASPRYTAFSPLSSPKSESPTRGNDTKSALEVMNELAANARRERKVLDLEISNSSLLAINRSLEKEVRKQKAEIRRFRRMSRAGHFSADAIGSHDETSAIGASSLGDLSDMSEEEGMPEDEDEEEDDEEPESSDSSLDDSALSPSAQLERDEAHRSRDQKRLQLDLSKHREMLNDSQKMNQSLRKCLGWTEQLIKDGQKALEYKVNVSDVKLGGRVLISEDDNEVTGAEESRGLLSPWNPLQNTMDALDSPFFPETSRVVDRDSGVHFDGSEHIRRSNKDSTATSSSVDSQGKSTSPVKDFRPKLPGQWVSYRDSSLKPQEDLAPLGSPFEERIRHLHASIDALEAS